MRIVLLSMSALFFVSCGANTVEFDDKLNDFTLDDTPSYLEVDPYKNAPLSAVLRLKKPLKELTITVLGQDDSDISYTWKDSTNTTFPIVGLYFDHTNAVILSTPTDTKNIKIVITNTLPDIFKGINVRVNNRPISPERKNFLNFFNTVGKLTDFFATDDFGKVRWYMKADAEYHAMKFDVQNENVVFSVLNSSKPEIVTFDMVGKTIRTIKGPKTHSYTVPEADKRFHHDMFYRDNGNIIVLDKSQYGVEDTILELNPKGAIVQEIAIGEWIRKTINGNKDDYTGLENFIYDSSDNPFDEYISPHRYPGMPPEQNAIDWAHINALSFDEESDTLYLSFRQHGIFAFDYNKQELKWIYIRSDYTLPAANKLFYNFPESAEYVYQIPALAPYILKGAEGPDHPHAITYLGDGELMVFDNSGNDGEYPAEGSRLLVFKVDEENKTVSTQWDYRHRGQDGEYTYAQIVSDMDKTPFGSYIGTYGSRSPFTYIEVSQDKTVLFDMGLDIFSVEPGDSDIAIPIACPMARLAQNGVFIYRGDYTSIYPSAYKSRD